MFILKYLNSNNGVLGYYSWYAKLLLKQISVDPLHVCPIN